MLRRLELLIVAAISVGFFAGSAQAGGDPAKGKDVFNRCAVCHNATKGGPNQIGPNLFGVVGRKAGTVANFSYSAAMKNSRITWTPDKLDAYLKHPALVVPGNRMPFAGVQNDGQRADLVAYLKTLK